MTWHLIRDPKDEPRPVPGSPLALLALLAAHEASCAHCLEIARSRPTPAPWYVEPVTETASRAA